MSVMKQEGGDFRRWPHAETGMAAHIRDHDWAATSLGPIDRWPQHLKTVVDLMLGSPGMMSLVWGADAIHLYNDGFTALLREHHATTLGRSAFATFARSSEVFAADVAAGMAGKSARLSAQRYPVFRNGRLGDAWFDVDYVPVRDGTGTVDGVLWILKETTAQVLAERALRESDARHRLLIDSWAQAVWEVDADGVVIADSPSWRAYTGQTLEELRGDGWLDAIHPDDRVFAERQWRDAVAARRPIDAEFRLRAPDGGWRWTNVRAAPVKDMGGAILKWAGMNIDIDARKRTETALRESEHLRGVALSGGRMGSWRWDRNADLIRGDEQFMALWGLPPHDEALPLAVFAARMSIEGAANLGEIVTRAVATNEALSGQLEIVSGPRTGSWVQWQGRAATDDPSVLFGVTFDITRQKAVEAKLREIEEHQRALIEGVPQLVWRAADDGRWTWTSPQWTELTGQREEDSHGWGWLTSVHPDDRAGVREAWAQAIGRGLFEADHRLCVRAEGSYRWFQARATPLRNDKGQITEWLGTSTDIHELRRARDRQRILLAELQHRVRNIMAMIRSVIRRTASGSQTVSDYAEHLEGRINAMARTQALLTRAPTMGVDLQNLVRDELEAQAAKPRQYECRGPDIALSAKAAEVLTLAVHELATNAVKYGALGTLDGLVDIRWAKEERPGQTWLCFDWTELRVALTPGSVLRTGFRTELVTRRVPYELKGKGMMEFGSTGLHARIEFPLVPGQSILQTDGGPEGEAVEEYGR